MQASCDGPIVVKKFGGTSVATSEGRGALRASVRDALAHGRSVVVVVSAMGRSGEPYATDTLLGLLDGLDVEPRECDLLTSCGEVVTAVLVAHELRADGVAAAAFTGGEAGVLTDAEFGNATIVRVDPRPLRTALSTGLVPVVAGFQGVSATGQVTTLGRGGSDTTACAIGAALKAECIEIHTDVDGVMSADPRACDGARVLDSLQFEELFQMALAGSKIMHAPAAETAMDAGVPVRVRNTYGDAAGTLVTNAAAAASTIRRVATAVSHVDHLARVVATLPSDDRAAALTSVFRSMADAGLSLDMFTPFGDLLTMSMGESEVEAAREVLAVLGVPNRVQIGLAKVTLVGAGMHGVPGVMARVAGALTSAGVEVLQIADSHYTISVLVSKRDSRPAIIALHTEFGLGVE